MADRWHLFQNMRLVLERLCQRAFADLQRLPLSPGVAVQISWTAKYRSDRRSSGEEARKQPIYDQRQRRFEAVQRLKQAGWSIKQIARHLRVSWATTRDDFKRERFLPMAMPRLRPSRLDRFAESLQTRWDVGHHNARQLWREIRDQGFSGSVRMVMLWAQVRREPTERHPGRRRFSQAVPTETSQAIGLPAASRLAWLLIRSPE